MTDTTTRPGVLRALADRVERGESGRDFECEMALAMGWSCHGGLSPYWCGPEGRINAVQAWTRSIDATEALRQAVLPGSKIAISNADGVYRADVWIGGDQYSAAQANAATLCQAYLSALLRALAAEMEAGS